MATKNRRDKNSLATKIETFSKAGEVVGLPEGVILRSSEEATIWEQFTRARQRDDWRDMDLIVLAKIVRIEADIRKYQVMLDEEGPIVQNQRGTQIENPLFRIIDTLQRQQLAMIRTMSLNHGVSRPETLNKAGKEKMNARNIIADGKKVESLLAQPE